MQHHDPGFADDREVLADLVGDVDGQAPEPIDADPETSAPPELEVEPVAAAPAAELLAAFADLRGLVEKSFAVLESQTGLVDRLHASNESLRRGEFDRMLDPFIRDVIALCDTCHRNAQAWLAKPDATPEDIHRVLTDVAGDVSLILDRQGVETFTPDRGERFDRGRHRAARTEPTDDAERDSTVAEALRPGYLRGARVIRFADVTVFRYLRASADE